MSARASGALTPSSRMSVLERDFGTQWTAEVRDYSEKEGEYTVYNIFTRSGRNAARAEQRFSAFLVLHKQIAPTLGLPLEFPVQKTPLSKMDVVKCERVVRLGRYLEDVLKAGGAELPAVRDFLRLPLHGQAQLDVGLLRCWLAGPSAEAAPRSAAESEPSVQWQHFWAVLCRKCANRQSPSAFFAERGYVTPRSAHGSTAGRPNPTASVRDPAGASDTSEQQLVRHDGASGPTARRLDLG